MSSAAGYVPVTTARKPPNEGTLALSSPNAVKWGHFGRAAGRVGILATGDAAVLLVIAGILTGWEAGSSAPGGSAGLGMALPASGMSAGQLIIGVLVCLLVLDAYTPGTRLQVVGARFGAAALGLALPYWGPLWHDFSPALLLGYLTLSLAVALALVASWGLLDALALRMVRAQAGPLQVLLVAHPQEVGRARRHPALSDPKEYHICGVFDPETLRRRKGAREALCSALKVSGADTVMLSCGSLDNEAFDAIQDAALATGTELMALGRTRAVPGSEPRVTWRNGIPVLLLTRPAWRTVRMFLKRALDIAGALAALLLLSPVMLIIASMLKLGGGGPVIFAQQRVGLGGRRFRCFKFRSMLVDAESLLQKDPVLYAGYLRNNFKLPPDKDPRITPLGRFLRRSSLDELPQFWNVLRGEMSLVGPRPLVPDELKQYPDTAQVLLSVKPGLAGAWAVNGRSNIDYPARADMELGYVRQWRVVLDLRLLARLFPAVISRRGSY